MSMFYGIGNHLCARHILRGTHHILHYFLNGYSGGKLSTRPTSHAITHNGYQSLVGINEPTRVLILGTPSLTGVPIANVRHGCFNCIHIVYFFNIPERKRSNFE